MPGRAAATTRVVNMAAATRLAVNIRHVRVLRCGKAGERLAQGGGEVNVDVLTVGLADCSSESGGGPQLVGVAFQHHKRWHTPCTSGSRDLLDGRLREVEHG